MSKGQCAEFLKMWNDNDKKHTEKSIQKNDKFKN